MKYTDFSSGRTNGISDGVFAIAMTLLVLDLKLQLQRDKIQRRVEATPSATLCVN